MMNGMTAGMTLGMGIVCVLVIIVLVLAAAALIKYLRSGSRAGRNEQVRFDRA
jgi:uncharacterized membrane protein